MSKLEKLTKLTTIVADTGEIEQIKLFKPTDATTNPSLIFKAASLPEYQFLIQDATESLGEGEELSDERLAQIVVECKKGGAGTNGANSTVKKFDKDGKQIADPSPGDTGGMTLEKFCSMGIVEKSKLYNASPDVYNTFMKAAKAKGKLV